MLSRVKEGHERTRHRIKRSDVGPFPCVTTNTRVGQIRVIGRSIVLEADYVIDVMVGK